MMSGLFDEFFRSREHRSVSGIPSSRSSGQAVLGAPGTLAATEPRRSLAALALVAAGVVAVLVSVLLGHVFWPSSSSLATGASPAGSARVADTGSTINVSSIAAKVDPGLVDINTTIGYQDAAGAATGMVLTSNGEVLTNNHVVEGATRISVTDLGNGRTYSASVVGYDPSKDVAVLQLLDASGLQTESIGNSASAAVGGSIVGIGNAGGAGGTPSAAAGSITAVHQSISAGDELTDSSEQLTGLIETNADIQPGDSGGPLVNSVGQVIGMDTAGSESGSFSFQTTSQAYAIPIDTALAVAKEIEASQGSTTVHIGATAFIGVSVEPTLSTSAGFGGFPGAFGNGLGFGGSAQSSQVVGLEIETVVPGTPAARAGLVAGDVITSFDGHAVTTNAALTDLLLLLHPGATAKVTWSDTSGASHTAMITLASGPAS